MVKRQKQALSRNNNPNSTSYSTPNTVSKPETDKALKMQELEAGRQSTILNLEHSYIDPIRKIKLKAYDLAIVNDSTSPKKLFKDVEPKPDRMKNRAVDYIIPHLKLLDFLIKNFNEHYRRKIMDSQEFQNIIKQYLGTGDYSKLKLSTDEKNERLNAASQWLMESLTIIEDNMDPKFKEVLKETGKPYFKLISAIADFTGKEITIPDRMYR